MDFDLGRRERTEKQGRRFGQRRNGRAGLMDVNDSTVRIGSFFVVGMGVVGQLRAVDVRVVAVVMGVDLACRNPAHHQCQHQDEPAQLPGWAAENPIELALEGADRHGTSMHESDHALNPILGGCDSGADK